MFGGKGKQKACRPCRNEYQYKWNRKNKGRLAASQKKYRDKNKDKVDKTYREYMSRPDVRERKKYTKRRARLRLTYGMTPEEYDELLDSQGGVCAICESPPKDIRLAVDHQHSTGRIRGLLCSSCNMAIGLMRDSVERLKRAIRYLEGDD